MDVRVDERRRDEPALGLEDSGVAGSQLASRPDRGDAATLDGDVGWLGPPAQRGMDSGVADEEIQGLTLRCRRRGLVAGFAAECGIRQWSASSSCYCAWAEAESWPLAFRRARWRRALATLPQVAMSHQRRRPVGEES